MVKYAIAALVVALVAARPVRGEIVLLDFASPTCGPCQQMIPTVESLEAAGYHVRRVDVTQEPQLAQQFGVTQVPCFVMLVDGREVNRMVGATSREQLEQMLLAAQPRGAAASSTSLPHPKFRTVARSVAHHATTDPWSGVSPNDSGNRTTRLQSAAPTTFRRT